MTPIDWVMAGLVFLVIAAVIFSIFGPPPTGPSDPWGYQ